MKKQSVNVVLVAILAVLSSDVAGCVPTESVTGDDASVFDAHVLDAPDDVQLRDAADTSESIDAPVMAEEPDAAAPDDGGESADDANPADDAGLDASADASPTDAAVRTDAAREECTSPGMYRTTSCECGGMISQRCTGGFWVDVTTCTVTPTCTPGEFETRDGSRCEVQQRVCTSGCRWGSWMVVVPPGVCNPGATVCDDVRGLYCICSEDCSCTNDPSVCS
jgi:hypothetical protein